MSGAARKGHFESVVLVGIVAVGALLRLWGVRFALPNPFARPDEEVIVDVALGFFTDANPHFFDWPTLFMYATGAVYAALFAFERLIGGSITSAAGAKAALEPVLYLIPRLLSVTAGVLTIPVLYAVARELFSRRVALVAAALLSVAFLHVRDSHFGVTDVSATFLTMCAFWAAARCATRGVTPGRVVATGLLCGLAVSTKYNTALILLPAAVAILHHTRWDQRQSLIAAVRAAGLLVTAAVLAFVAGTPFSVLDSVAFVTAVTNVGHHLASGHVVMARGWAYHTAFTFRYGLGVPLTIAALAGAGWLAGREPWKAFLVLVFPLSYYLVLGSGLTVFVRYMMPMVPFLCLTAAFLIDRFGKGVVVAIVTVLTAAPTTKASIAFDRLMTRTDTRVIAENWVASRYRGGATLYQSGYGYSHVFPRPFGLYSNYTFNERSNTFLVNGAATDLPDLVVLLDSPLGTYTQVPPAILPIVDANYVLAETVDGASAASAPGAIYDQDDAFFAPFAGIEAVSRPGPTVRIFERRRRW